MPRRINNISVAILGTGVGIGWERSPGDKDIAREIVAFLLRRQLLLETRLREEAMYCISQANEIRAFLGEKLILSKLGPSLAESLRGTSEAMKAFTDAGGPGGRYFRRGDPTQVDPFSLALGELRTQVGLFLAVISDQYGIDIDPDLT